MKPVIGLDVGGTKCAVVLARVDHGIDIVDKIRFDTHAERGLSYTLNALFEAIEEIMTRHALAPCDVAAIGVSCGGPLDSRRGVVLCPPNLPGWENVPLTQMLQQRFGIAAFLENDANACALLEWKLGAGRGTQNMVFLTMGTGMGAGIIAEGKLLRGHTGMGGEVGHLRLTEEGPVGFMKAGSFEGHASGGGIGRQAQAFTSRRVAEGNPPKWTRDGVLTADVTTKLIAEYAASGNEDALSLFHQAGAMLGRGIALLVDTLNPECIVIGSVFARCEAFLRPAMEETLRAEAISFSLAGLRIVPAQTGESLGDLACCIVALHALDMDPLHTGPEKNGKVLCHLEKLMQRHPELSAQRENILAAYETLRDAFRHGGKLLLCGNGGSCADAQHILGELMKGFYLSRPLPPDVKQRICEKTKDSMPAAADKLQGALPAIALSEHSTLLTAFANDVDASLVYAQQVIGYGRPGDVLLGISTSGNARNVLLATQVASAQGLRTIALTGGDGGLLQKASDVSIVVPAICQLRCRSCICRYIMRCARCWNPLFLSNKIK